MTPSKGQTVFFTTPYDNNERCGIVQETTAVGYLINGVWYSKRDVQIKNVLLDSRNTSNNQQLILG